MYTPEEWIIVSSIYGFYLIFHLVQSKGNNHYSQILFRFHTNNKTIFVAVFLFLIVMGHFLHYVLEKSSWCTP